MLRAIQSAFVLTALLVAAFHAADANAQTRPLKAPRLDIVEWLNSPAQSLHDLRGKVVVIGFFQLECPGSNKFTLPLLKHWEKSVFAREIKDGRLVILSIHSVFEGHAEQSPEHLRRFIEEKGITHPVGIDRHTSGQRVPETMLRYNVMGTPEMLFLGKMGRIRFQRFGFFKPAVAEDLLRELLDEKESLYLTSPYR